MSADNTYTLRIEGTLTAETTVAVCPPHLSQRASGDNRPLPIPRTPDGRPLVPAGTLRGAFRRGSWKSVYKKLCDHAGEPVLLPYGAVLKNIIGGNKGSQSERPYDPAADLRDRTVNPHMSLWGGNQPWMEGKVKVSQANMRRPERQGVHDHNLAVTVSGKRSDPIRSGDVSFLVLPPDDRRAYNSNITAQREKTALGRRVQILEAALANLEVGETGRRAKPSGRGRKTKTIYELPKGMDADTAYHLLEVIDLSQPIIREEDVRAALWAAQQKLDAIKGSMISDVSTLLPLAGYEGIGPGSECDHDMFVENATAIEVGLLLHGLSLFSLTPFIGGHKNHMSGKISLDYEVFRLDEQNERYVRIGKLVLKAYRGLEIAEDDGLLAECLNAWKTADLGQFNFLNSETEPDSETQDDEEAVDA